MSPGFGHSYGFEPIHAAKGWEEKCPEEHNKKRPNPAKDDCGDSTHPRGSRSGFELAQLIGGADEDRVHRAYAASLFIGGIQLNEGLPYHYAHHVRRAKHGKNGKRKKKRP
jgi:hypothetical protein